MRIEILKGLSAGLPFLLAGCSGSESPRPNILIAIGDDISWPHMSAYGCTFVNTPGFDRVAEEGILFNNAYTPNAKSAPSRACLLTGLNSWQLKEAANHVPFFPQEFQSFIEVLGREGYITGFTAKGWAPGTALDSAGKPRQLTGKPWNSKKTPAPASGISNNDYAANFEDFLANREPGKPFCFWYGSTEPHRRYEYGSGISKGNKQLTDADPLYKFWPDNDTVRNDVLDYAFEVEHYDSHLLKMIEHLEVKGELANTIIIVTADNGMPFPRVKGNPYGLSNHMPLAIMWPEGINKPGRVVDDYISFIDIAPTLLELAGIADEAGGMQKMEGKSFTNILYSRSDAMVDRDRDFLLIGQERHDVGRPDDQGYPVRGILRDGYLYLRNYKPDRWPAGNPETGYLNTDGSPTKTLILSMKRRGQATELWDLSFGKRMEEELYFLRDDRECLNDLSNDPAYSELKNELSRFMEEQLVRQGDPRMAGNGDIFDRYPYSENRTRDFFNRYMRSEVGRRDAGWVDSTDFEPLNSDNNSGR